MRKTYRLLLSATLLLLSVQSIHSQRSSSSASLYLQREEQPDPVVYLPAPPDTCSYAYIDDFAQWQWGKTIRYTARGERASEESLSGASIMARIFSDATGIKIGRSETPAIYKLLSRSYSTAEQSYKNAKEKYMRTRPFAQYHEHPTGRYDNERSMRGSGSYPSGHTSRGMASALVFAELMPEYQDTILRRGFEYGESRLIVAAHYQSDVYAGYTCASVCVAVMHSVPEFQEDFEAARAEYIKIAGQKKDQVIGYPDGRRILSEPVDTASSRYYADVAQYFAAKTERSTARGEQARADADLDYEAVMSNFSDALGLKIDAKSTPAMAALVRESRNALQRNALDLGYVSKFRKRPYIQLGDAPFAGANDSQTSSFPSAGSEIGWGIALILSEIAPVHANEILTRGYQMGVSGMITGQSWASDIHAGRIMASGMVARLHADAAFRKLLNDAKKEYESKK